MRNENFAEKLAAEGLVCWSEGVLSLENVPWVAHERFDGVAMKDVVTAAQTGGAFSYHLVRIAPGKAIGQHTHPTQWESHEVVAGAGYCVMADATWRYEPGVVALLPPNVAHEVQAGEAGLYLLAKFIPALV